MGHNMCLIILYYKRYGEYAILWRILSAFLRARTPWLSGPVKFSQVEGTIKWFESMVEAGLSPDEATRPTPPTSRCTRAEGFVHQAD
jgi:pentatricopeptide repeat protein